MDLVRKLCLDLFAMAGFQVTLYGRFWVTPKENAPGFVHAVAPGSEQFLEKAGPVGAELSKALGEQLAFLLDLSFVDLPPLSQVRYICTKSADELDHESFAIAHPQNLHVTKGPIRVEVYGLLT